MRIIFAGTPEFAIPPLQMLIDEGCDIAAVLTQPDRRAGRGKKLRAGPVKQLALKNELKVLQPQSLRDQQWQRKLAAFQPDLMVVVAYGLMIPDWLLVLPRLGCWNVHASLLPRWRGAAPIHRAIEAGDEQTGVCIMQMDATLDTGPVYHCLKSAIDPQDTTGFLHDRLADMGADALRYCLNRVATGNLMPAQVQDDSQAIYAHKLSKAEAELDWNQPAEVLQRRIRAFNPWPVAWCELDGQRLRIWQAEVVENQPGLQPGEAVTKGHELVIGTTDKALRIMEIQRAGGQRMSATEFLNAARIER